MKGLVLFILSISFISAFSQEHGFRFGEVTLKHFNQAILPRDSAASAIVLDEFGEASVSNHDNHDLIFEHHYIIKILKKSGVEEANISIPLYKNDKVSERLLSVSAIAYNIVNNQIQQTPLDEKSVFTENTNKQLDKKKFTIPNVNVGTIIEVYYTLESPFFVRNFRQWEFQSHLPKVASEYWATIPGNYNYNMSLKGFLKLKKSDSEIIKNCFDVGGGNKADCARYKFGMQNIPAFIEEDYMTARSNFVSSVNFELLEIKYFDGRVNKVTNEWKNADNEMARDPNFGGQLKKGKDISQKIEPLIAGVTDPLEKAKRIYDFIKNWYRLNGYFGKYSDMGIKKAFEEKTGNVGDINLSLIAALRYGGLNVEPLVLSTRANGTPTDLFPVLSDFNYVVAKLNINDKVYLLDASDPLLPFGLLPEHCLNGRGRVFNEKSPSYWYDLNPTEKYKRVTTVDLVLEPTGKFKGTIQHHYFGYRAFDKRKQMVSFTSQEEYLEDLKKKLSNTTVINYEVKGVGDPNDLLTEKLEVEMEGFENMNSSNLLFNPFFTGRIEQNPFRSNERLYPVDYGAPLETVLVVNITYPAFIELESAPEKVGLILPNSGGRFMFEVTTAENRLTINYLLAINKTVFNSAEYQYLKELYDRVIQTQGTDLLFKRKK